MRTPLKKNLRLPLVSGLLALALWSPAESRGAEPNRDDALPPGSIVYHGTPKPTNDLATGSISPEYLFGLKIQQAMTTNAGVCVITQAVDLDALYHRFVPTLPVSDDVKQREYALPNVNAVWRLVLLKDIASEVITHRLYFLGLRYYGSDTEMVFRDVNAIGGPSYIGCPLYVGYVTQRQPDWTVRIVDVHRFISTGEMLSQTLRRQTLRKLAKERLLRAPINASDAVLVANEKAVADMETRYDFGRYFVLRDYYNKLPPQLQNDPYILFQMASCGEQRIADFVPTIERLHQLHPDDPSPRLILVDDYWRVINNPLVPANETPQDDQDLADAIEKANLWFDDPALEVRLAIAYGTNQPVKARPLLLQAIQRKPPFPSAFSQLLRIDLSQRNYAGVAETLHQQEVAFQTNLTAMVNASANFANFKNSPAFKKWQQDHHAATSTAAN